MVTINSDFSLTRLNNAEFASLMLNTQKLLLDGDRETLGVEASTFVEFNKAVQALVDQVYYTQGSQYTAIMQNSDAKRDLLYKKIRLKLQMVEIAEEDSPLLACRDVVQTYLLSKYTARVPQMPQQEETAVIHGFIYDLRNKLKEADIEALGIEDDITKLETANNDFMEAYGHRSGERADGDTGLTHKLRQQLSELYTAICIAVQFYANSTVAENKESAEAGQTFVKLLNVILVDVKRRLDARTNKTAVSENGEGAGAEGGQGGSQAGSEGGSQPGGETSGNGGAQGGDTGQDGKPGGNAGGGSGDGGGTGSKPDDGGVVNGGNVEW